MTRRTRGRVLAVAVALACVAIETPVSGDVAHTRSDFWRSVAEPGAGRARELLRQARVIVRTAFPTAGSFGDEMVQLERRVAIDNALARLERARALAPRDPEILWFYAELLTQWRRPQGRSFERRDDEAIAAFGELRRVDPEFQVRDVAASLAELHTRRRDFTRAADEYQRAIRASLDERATTVLWSNLAEMQMLSGDLDSAVASYQRSLELARSGGQDSLAPALASWGLAIALDRLGEHRSALDRATDAIGFGGGTLEVLRSPSVFFEPTFELHWYEALGHEALAGNAAAAVDVDLSRHAVASAVEWLRAASRVLRASEVARAWGLLTDAGDGPDPGGLAGADRFARAVDELRHRHPEIRSERATGAAAQLALAVESWHRFFGDGGSASPWAQLARARTATLVARVRELGDADGRASRRTTARRPAPRSP